MIGKTIYHYTILDKLGEGGMGVVYKARDIKLDRLVALKFLPDQLDIGDTDMTRFIQEAKAVAALNHPNACTIHEIHDERENPFIVMEYIEGKTLRELLDNVLPCPGIKDSGPGEKTHIMLNSVIDITLQIAAALEEAHSKGIIHRDIKPENIMLDAKDRIKVMDFGLVKLKGPMNLTREGSTVGTVSYMAPEQIQGENIDHRSDIFSFGVVLYEMCTGFRPFRGEHEAAVIYSVMNEEPQPLSVYVPDIPAELEQIIQKMLKKDPSQRYQLVEDLLSDLTQLKRKTSKRAVAPAESPSSKSSSVSRLKQRTHAGLRSYNRLLFLYASAVLLIILIAAAAYRLIYLPMKSGTPALNSGRIFISAFENRTGDPSLDPIGRLVADWTIQGILQNELAEVIPTTTMLQLLENAEPVGGGLADRTKLIGLAKATHSGILVSGVFYQIGREIQFHAQIIDAEHNDIIFTLEPVRGPRTEPMKAINALQQKIMGALAMHVYLGSDIRMMSDPPIYEAYLEFMEGTRYFGVDYNISFDHYRKAIEIDPDFIHPKLRIAVGYGNLGKYSLADSILQSINHERHRLSPYERYYLDWFTLLLQGRLEESFAVLLHLESIAPMDMTTNYITGLLALYLNRPQQTVETFAKIDIPLRWADFAVLSWRFGVLCNAHHLLGHYETELEVARMAQEYYPGDLDRRANEVCALAALGMVDSIHTVIGESKNIRPSSGSAGYVMLTASRELRAHKNRTEALHIAEQAIHWYEEQDRENRSGLAEAFYLAERWDESYTVRKELAVRNPDNITHKGALGTLAARRGNEAEARRIAAELENMDRPYLFGLHTYLRARIHALLGEHAEAVKLIRESFDQGRHFDLYIHHDMDLEPLHSYPPFEELLKPKG